MDAVGNEGQQLGPGSLRLNAMILVPRGCGCIIDMYLDGIQEEE